MRTAMPPASMGLPSNSASPSVAGKRPVSIFMVVDLPQPLEPRKPKISPFSMRKLTLSTAVKSPKRLVSPCASIAGGEAGSGTNGVIANPPEPCCFSDGSILI